jgi:hypothetical protein
MSQLFIRDRFSASEPRTTDDGDRDAADHISARILLLLFFFAAPFVPEKEYGVVVRDVPKRADHEETA